MNDAHIPLIISDVVRSDEESTLEVEENEDDVDPWDVTDDIWLSEVISFPEVIWDDVIEEEDAWIPEVSALIWVVKLGEAIEGDTFASDVVTDEEEATMLEVIDDEDINTCDDVILEDVRGEEVDSNVVDPCEVTWFVVDDPDVPPDWIHMTVMLSRRTWPLDPTP